MPAPINKMSELFFQSSSVELPYSRNNILLNDFCKQSDKLGEGGDVRSRSHQSGGNLFVLSEVFSVCGAAQLKLMIGWVTSLLLISHIC